MRRKVLSLLATLLFAVPAARAAETAALTLPVPESISAQGVPPIPARNVEDLLPYQNLRAGLLSDWHTTERRLLIRTRFAESPQIHEVAMPMGARTQLTFYRDPVSEGLYRQVHREQIVYSLNEGGAENFQFFLLDRKTGRARRFTDGTHRYTSPVWSRDGKLLAYASNARNGRDMDVYVADPSTPGSERRSAEVQDSWSPLHWSADNRRILRDEFIPANETYLHWVPVENTVHPAGGEIHTITPRNKRGRSRPSPIRVAGGRR